MEREEYKRPILKSKSTFFINHSPLSLSFSSRPFILTFYYFPTSFFSLLERFCFPPLGERKQSLRRSRASPHIITIIIIIIVTVSQYLYSLLYNQSLSKCYELMYQMKGKNIQAMIIKNSGAKKWKYMVTAGQSCLTHQCLYHIFLW